MYGRGDRFGNQATLNMDIWLDRDGNLLARFWTRSLEYDDLSIKIHGINPKSIPARDKDSSFSDTWIPKAVRDEYEEWIARGW